MPAKTFRNTKRNNERIFLRDKGLNVIWHHKRSYEAEGLFQLALNELAKCKETDAFTIYNRLRATREYLQSSARVVPEDEIGEVTVDPCRHIDVYEYPPSDQQPND